VGLPWSGHLKHLSVLQLLAWVGCTQQWPPSSDSLGTQACFHPCTSACVAVPPSADSLGTQACFHPCTSACGCAPLSPLRVAAYRVLGHTTGEEGRGRERLQGLFIPTFWVPVLPAPWPLCGCRAVCAVRAALSCWRLARACCLLLRVLPALKAVLANTASHAAGGAGWLCSGCACVCVLCVCAWKPWHGLKCACSLPLRAGSCLVWRCS